MTVHVSNCERTTRHAALCEQQVIHDVAAPGKQLLAFGFSSSMQQPLLSTMVPTPSQRSSPSESGNASSEHGFTHQYNHLDRRKGPREQQSGPSLQCNGMFLLHSPASGTTA